MTNSFGYYQQTNDHFRQFVLVSLFLHLSFFIFFFLKGIIYSSEVVYVPESIRVDIVDLPDKIPDKVPDKTPDKIEPIKAPDIPQKLEPKMSETTKKVEFTNAQSAALNKLKTKDAIEELKKAKLAEQLNSKSKPAAPLYKGSIISSGNSFTGLSKLKVNEYLSNLVSKIREEWVLPQWLSTANLKASVLVSVDKQGRILQKKIYSSSGNSIFDASCITAVESASPFDPPPAEIEEALLLIRFPFE